MEGPLDPSGNPVSGVTYKVAYAYYNDASHPESFQNLQSVTLDSEGLARTTTYTYTSVSGTYTDPTTMATSTNEEDGLLASISDPLGETVSYNYSLNSASSAYPNWDGGSNYSEPFPTQTIWINGISEPASDNGAAATLHWEVGTSYATSEDFFYYWPDIGEPAEPNVDGTFLAFTTTVTCQNLQTTYGNAAIEGLGVSVGVDNHFRTISVYLDDTYIEDTILGNYNYLIAYDSSNNVLRKGLVDGTSSYTGFAPNFGLIHSDVNTYDGHGNVISHYVYGYPGTDTASYYDSSKYFAKNSVTDALGHTAAIDYFDDNDASQGNWGEVKSVRDAGYSVSGSPSYGKEFDYTYNQYGQKLTESNLKGVVSANTYGDSYGNLTQVVQDPSNTTTGHVGLNRTTQMSYDLAGHVLQTIDPSGHESVTSYNTLGQPLTTKFYSDAGVTLEETISYSYGANGRAASVTDNRGTTSMTYETGCDRIASVTDPVTGTVSYTYNVLGGRASLTLPNVGTYTYAWSTPYYTWNSRYGWTLQSTPNVGNNHNVLSSDDPGKVGTSLMYITDPDGRRVDVQMNAMGGANQINAAKSYDTSGNLFGQLVTQSIQEGYNGEDTPNHNQFDYFTYYTSHRLSRLSTLWNQPYTNSSGTTVTNSLLLHQNDYVYNNGSQRTSNTVSHQGFDASGLPQVDGSGNAVLTADRDEQYGYDALRRLTSVDYGDGETQSYSFDAMGNRTAKSDTVTSGGSATTVNESYSVDAANRLTGKTVSGTSTTVTSDADGNTLTDGTRTNTWDSQNRLVQCVTSGSSGTTSAFVYSCDGMRRRGTVTASDGTKTRTDYVYDNSMLVEEIVQHVSATGTALDSPTYVSYLQGPQGPLYRKASTGADASWYVYDGLGSVVGEVSVTGTMTASKLFDVYGATRGYTGSPTTRQGFVGGLGHETDDETGLMYMRARYYDPTIGRFISQDPAKQGRSWFTYCDDSPVNKVDANGKSPKDMAALTVFFLLAGELKELLKGSLYVTFANAAGVAAWLTDEIDYYLGFDEVRDGVHKAFLAYGKSQTDRAEGDLAEATDVGNAGAAGIGAAKKIALVLELLDYRAYLLGEDSYGDPTR